MNVRVTQIISLLLIFLSSCKNLQRVTSRDNSARSTTSSKKIDPRFLDDVAITPGKQKNTNYNYNKPNKPNSKKSFSTNASFNLEQADWLQIKYAIMTDMSVEQLNNLPLLKEIDHWWGTRYCMGGNNESCIDCSAFTQTMLRDVYGVDVPRTANEQYGFSTKINDTEIREGDLVFFKSGRSVSHVGLYVGNYKFVHAATSGGVMISDLNDSYWGKKYAGAGRVIQ
jgi:lipoprotein Spr